MKEFVISEAQVETAILVGLITQTQDERKTKEYLDELEFLAETAGATVVKRFTQKLPAYAGRECAAGRTSMLCPGQFQVDTQLSRNSFNICNDYVFQVQQFCGIIFVEHRDLSFVVIGGTFIIKDFFSMLNFFT